MILVSLSAPPRPGVILRKQCTNLAAATWTPGHGTVTPCPVHPRRERPTFMPRRAYHLNRWPTVSGRPIVAGRTSHLSLFARL